VVESQQVEGKMNRLAGPAIIASLCVLAVSCSDDSVAHDDSDNGQPTTPLEVISTYPLAGAEVPVTDSIVLTFSRDLDCKSVNSTTVTVGPNRTGTFTCDSNIAEFHPDFAFDFAITVEVTVSKNVTDLSGIGLEKEFSYIFYTEVEPGCTADAKSPNR
jgi:hypothetical protein